MLARALRSLLFSISISIIVILALDLLVAVATAPGLTGVEPLLPNLLFAAAVIALVGGGSAAGTIRGRGPVVLRDHVRANVERGRFAFSVVAFLVGFLYFGLALAFYFTGFGLELVLAAILVPVLVVALDSIVELTKGMERTP